MAYIGRTPTPAALTASDIADGIISEAKMADDAISLTELKAGTDGEVISWDASGNPVAIGAGTSGHFLKSQGAGSQPVFAAAGGGWEFVEAITASSDATVIFTTAFVSGYDYQVTGTNILPATDNQDPRLQFGTAVDTFITSNYTGLGWVVNQSGSISKWQHSTFIYMSGTSVGNATDEDLTCEFTIYDPYTNANTSVLGFVGQKYGDGVKYWGAFNAIQTDTNVVTHLKFYFASGNVASGNFKLYRRANA